MDSARWNDAIVSGDRSPRYLWAAHQEAKLIPAGKLVAERYQAIAPQIWLDTSPQIAPLASQTSSDEIFPYQKLSARYLHCPQAYGYAQLSAELGSTEVLLLANVPIDARGNLMPSIIEAWSEAPPVRQVYWLWQILQLWPSLAALNVASSLLVAENLRVEAWRVRLLQLYPDASDRSQAPNLQMLGNCWASWFATAQEPVNSQLQAIYQQLQSGQATVEAIALQLNLLLLQQSARLPLNVEVASKSDRDPDSCYPPSSPSSPLSPHLSIACTPTSRGAEGATVSRWAVKSIQILVKALLKEVAEQPQIMPPEVVEQQLAAIIRITHNLIAARHQELQVLPPPPGATLAMAIQLPQRVPTPSGTASARELYIAQLGDDSRAYWLDARQIVPLTVSRQAIEPAPTPASPQALGIGDAELLHPQIQRLILEADGLLLLCSPGFDDSGAIEQFGADWAPAILAGKMSLEEAVRFLTDMAHQLPGGDRLSVVLSYYRLT
jgi:protein phosphatase